MKIIIHKRVEEARIPKRSRHYWVYVLLDPDTGAIRYVGKTTNIRIRASQHLSKAYLRDTPNRCWIHDLRLQGKEPIMEVVDVWFWDWSRIADSLEHTEGAWMKRLLLQGEDLTNCDHKFVGIKKKNEIPD